MKKTTIAIAVVLALLSSTFVLECRFALFSEANFFPNPGPDLPRIYIRSDGTVEPTTAPIEKTGNTYKLTGNIVLYTIEVQRDDIILDGAGHTIQGNASRPKGYDDGNNGVIVTGQNNVTLKHIIFAEGDTGVRISDSAYVTIDDSLFCNGTARGIVVKDSTFVQIEGNVFADILGDYPSISLKGSNNTIMQNRITGSIRGIEIEGSFNLISDNRIESLLPMNLNKASSNTITKNNITGPSSSYSLPEQNSTGNEGITLLVDCSNNLISQNNLTGFINEAIRMVFGSNNTVYANYMANNQIAIELDEAVNNTFYGNTFKADSLKIAVYTKNDNFWDNGTMGNYWDNYNGTDINGDGIGDSPYTIIGYKWDIEAEGFVGFSYVQDNYPLMASLQIEYDNAKIPQTEPFPTTLLFGSVIVIAVLAGLGLLVYFKKLNRAGKHEY
jgi:Periplasmic copper-binding protein (NosD)